MKIWIWGLSNQGMIWEKLLTDTDGQYVELQSGRMFNQPLETSSLSAYRQYGFMPYVTDTWEEHWYPVKEIEGMVKANQHGALNVIQKEKETEILFCPTAKINEKIIVWADDEIIYEGNLNADPLQTWRTSIAIDTENRPLVINIGNVMIYNEKSTSEEATTIPQRVEGEATTGNYAT